MLPIPQEDILAQVSEEIQIARDFVNPKRQEFRNRLKLYNNQRKQRDKIGDTTLYNVMNTFLSIYYTDKMDITFAGREFGDDEHASKIQNVANFDYEEMGMDEVNYLTQWDRFFFGVGIRQLSEWDEKRLTPIPKSLDTLSWLPDPAGHTSLKNFRFMGFEVEYSEDELTEERGFFDTDTLQSTDSQGSENEVTKSYLREAQNLNNNEYRNLKNSNKKIYNMIDWFTIIEGEDGVCRKYLITVDDKAKNLVRCEELPAVTKEEKETPSLVPFPIVLNYFSPTRHDPFGTSIADLVEDKQRAKSVLKNLKLQAIKAAIYPMYVYNRDQILNRRDLDFSFNKFIAVRGSVSDGTIMPINKAPTRFVETLNEEQALDKDIQVATGADVVSQGVTSETSRTLGEVQQVQANANIRFLLGSKINNWGEKTFWELWYRLYKQNFKSSQKKMIRIQNAISSRFATIVRKDFITKKDPDIIVSSKSEIEQRKNADRLAFTTLLPIINQDPSKPLASKRFAERKLLRLYGIPTEEIQVMSPESPDESRARMENELLSRNQSVDVKIDEDHLSHQVIHSQAEDTDAVNSHIEAHRRSYYVSGQADLDKAKMMSTPMGGLANMAMNSVTNQMGQQMAPQAKPVGEI